MASSAHSSPTLVPGWPMAACARRSLAAVILSGRPALRPRARAEACRDVGRSQDRLVVDHAAGVVRRPAADDRDHFRDGGVVSQRPAARADPLGAGARSRREAGTASVSGDRHRNHPGRNPRLVRLATITAAAFHALEGTLISGLTKNYSAVRTEIAEDPLSRREAPPVRPIKTGGRYA
jgi:hypothetical protein